MSDTNETTLTQQNIDLAASQEESQRLTSQVKYFSDRVVLLRALVNSQQAEIKDLKAQLENQAEPTKEDENDGSAD